RVQPATKLTSGVSWFVRPLVAADAVAFYLYKLLVPMSYTVDYGRTPRFVVESRAVCWTWIAMFLLAVLAWRAWRVRPVLAAGIVCFVAALVPVLGLIQFDFQEYSTVGDHYVYTAMLGAALVMADLLPRLRWTTATVVAAVVLVPLAARSIAQTRHW